MKYLTREEFEKVDTYSEALADMKKRCVDHAFRVAELVKSL